MNTTIFSLGMDLLFSQPSARDAGSIAVVRLGGNSNSPEEAIDSLRASGLFEDVAGEDVEAYANFNDGTETRRVFARRSISTLGLKPTDPLSFGAVTIVMLLTDIFAAVGPMRRAVTVDPNIALRYG